jgi:hypothetical protein
MDRGVSSDAIVAFGHRRLEQVGGRVLGVVMNRFEPRVHGPASHPYSAYYY